MKTERTGILFVVVPFFILSPHMGVSDKDGNQREWNKQSKTCKHIRLASA